MWVQTKKGKKIILISSLIFILILNSGGYFLSSSLIKTGTPTFNSNEVYNYIQNNSTNNVEFDNSGFIKIGKYVNPTNQSLIYKLEKFNENNKTDWSTNLDSVNPMIYAHNKDYTIVGGKSFLSTLQLMDVGKSYSVTVWEKSNSKFYLFDNKGQLLNAISPDYNVSNVLDTLSSSVGGYYKLTWTNNYFPINQNLNGFLFIKQEESYIGYNATFSSPTYSVKKVSFLIFNMVDNQIKKITLPDNFSVEEVYQIINLKELSNKIFQLDLLFNSQNSYLKSYIINFEKGTVETNYHKYIFCSTPNSFYCQVFALNNGYLEFNQISDLRKVNSTKGQYMQLKYFKDNYTATQNYDVIFQLKAFSARNNEFIMISDLTNFDTIIFYTISIYYDRPVLNQVLILRSPNNGNYKDVKIYNLQNAEFGIFLSGMSTINSFPNNFTQAIDLKISFTNLLSVLETIHLSPYTVFPIISIVILIIEWFVYRKYLKRIQIKNELVKNSAKGNDANLYPISNEEINEK